MNRSTTAPQADGHLSSDEPASRGAKLALTAALLGWMFDGAEMGVFSLVGRPALKNLLPPSEESNVALYMGVITAMFLVGAATGGVLFGWLGDRIGRVKAMMFSVLCYAVFTALCGLATNPNQLGILRFIASLGMGGEWALGVALVMEVWPNRSRAYMAGMIGAAANVGYLLVAFTGIVLSSLLVNLQELMQSAGISQPWIDHWTANSGWRLLMILGILPAALTFFIRLFVPESEKWREEKARGHTAHWATVDLLGVLVGAMGPAVMVYAYAFSASASFRIAATIGGITLALAGYTYPVFRYLRRLQQSGPATSPTSNLVTSAALTSSTTSASKTIGRMLLAACLSGVALLGTWGSTQNAPTWVDQLTEADKAAGTVLYAREYTLLWMSVGAIVGTMLSAWLGEKIGRRPAYFLQCVLAMGSVWLLFLGNQQYGPWLLGSAFIAGVCTASFYGWLPLYLPELFPTNVRATGQGFGFNFGRILAAVGSFQLGALTSYFGGYPAACSCLSLIYLVGMVIIWFAPETRGQPLPD